MSLRIANQKTHRIGKYGQNFIDLYRDFQRNPEGSNLTLLPAVGSGALSSPTTRICIQGSSTGKNPRNKLFAIENGTPEPTEGCRTTDGLLRLMDRFGRINDNNDPYLNDDPSKDFTQSIYDIQNSDFYGRGVSANNQLDNVVAVSGITFRIAAVPKNINAYYVALNQYSPDEIEGDFIIKNASASFGYDDSVASSHYYNLCDPNAIVPKPVIVTDKRNAEATVSTVPGNTVTSTRTVYSLKWRYYVEIRHGLNTEKYFFNINTNPYIQNSMRVAKKKNSIILKWYTSVNSDRNTQVKNTISANDPTGQLYDLPEFLDIMFYADPCDINALSQEELGV